VMTQPLRFWWIGVSALLVCVGSIGPWAKVLFISVGGLDGDGWITLIAGLCALALLAVYVRGTQRPRPVWPLGLLLIAGVIAGGTGIYDWAQIESVVGDTSEDALFDLGSAVSVGWGLVLVTLSAASLVAATVVTAGRRGQEPASATGSGHVSSVPGDELQRPSEQVGNEARTQHDAEDPGGTG
jgi:hypothetical protein